MLIDIISLIIILGFAFAGYRNWRKGTFKLIAKVGSFIGAMIISLMFCGVVSKSITDNHIMPKVHSVVVESINKVGLNDTINGFIKNIEGIKSNDMVKDITDKTTSALNTPEMEGILEGIKSKTSGVTSILTSIAPNVNVDNLKKALSAKTPEQAADIVVDTLYSPVNGLIKGIAFLLMFVILHLLIGLVLNALCSVTLPEGTPLKIPLQIAGIALGFVQGVLIMLALGAVMFKVVPQDNSFYQQCLTSNVCSLGNSALETIIHSFLK